MEALDSIWYAWDVVFSCLFPVFVCVSLSLSPVGKTIFKIGLLHLQFHMVAKNNIRYYFTVLSLTLVFSSFFFSLIPSGFLNFLICNFSKSISSFASRLHLSTSVTIEIIPAKWKNINLISGYLFFWLVRWYSWNISVDLRI